jgi:hypothetical protein
MVIEVTFDVTDVYISTTVSPVYVNVSFEAPSGGGAAVWGGITGTLSDQTDLQTALDAKFDDPTGTTSQYLRGDGSLATFPSLTGFVPYTGATGDVNLGTHRILAQNATIASSGSGDTVTLNHSSGSGVGLNITKGGNGEGLYINKTSGSGNAATIIGTLNATTLVKSGGTSSQFLKADGSVDSSVYVPTSTTLTINGVSYDLSANRSWTVAAGISGSGASGQVAYWTGTSAQAGSNDLFWDSTNARLGIGTNSPAAKVDINLGAGSLTNAVYLRNSSSTGYSSITMFDNRNSSLYVGQWGLFGSSVTGNISNMFFYNTAGGGIGFYVGSGTNLANDLRLLITNTGNTLLGTSTDSGQRLQVQGTTLLNGNVTFSSATGMFWDATNSRLGIGTNTPTAQLHVSGATAGVFLTRSGANDAFILMTDTTLTSGGQVRGLHTVSGLRFTNASSVTEWARFHGTGNFSINSTTDSGERLQVTGTMKVTGLSTFFSGAYFDSVIQLGFASTNTNTSAFSNSTAFPRYSQNNSINRIFYDNGTYNPTSGTGTYSAFETRVVINQTGGANGITRGLYVNPTLTSAADFRAIETARGNVVFGNLPTSPVGLPTGAIWNNLGILTIV